MLRIIPHITLVSSHLAQPQCVKTHHLVFSTRHRQDMFTSYIKLFVVSCSTDPLPVTRLISLSLSSALSFFFFSLPLLTFHFVPVNKFWSPPPMISLIYVNQG